MRVECTALGPFFFGGPSPPCSVADGRISRELRAWLTRASQPPRYPGGVSSSSKQRGVAALGRTFGLAWGGVLGATLGFGIMMAGVLSPLDEVDEWWQWVITIPLALAFVVFGCGVAVMSVHSLVNTIALGWWGMFLGQCPAQEYGPRGEHRAQALGSALYLIVAGILGVLLFRVGAREGELNWTLEGLFLAFSGLAFGLGALIPRLYFGRLPKEGGRRPRMRELELPETWSGLVVAVVLAIGLSFGICKGFAETKSRAERAAIAAQAPAEGQR